MSNRPMTEKQKARLADKLVRIAYDLEYDAARLRKSGNVNLANSLQEVSSRLGNIGRHSM